MTHLICQSFKVAIPPRHKDVLRYSCPSANDKLLHNQQRISPVRPTSCDLFLTLPFSTTVLTPMTLTSNSC